MNNKMKIFATGASGLIGTRISELLADRYTITNLSLETGVNITEPSTLYSIRNDTEHSVLIHLAAKADVDGCEKDKVLGENGDAYKINVIGTQNILDACKVSNKKIIYISTDFVFDGENTPDGGYTEESKPNPINWYSATKYKGEEVVRNSDLPFLIVRLAYPYRKEFVLKKDFARAILERLQNKQQVMAITDHMMTPTYIDDIAFALGKVIEQDTEGIVHVAGSQSLSPYDAAMHIAKAYSLDSTLIQKTTRAEYFIDKAPRPFNSSLNNGKIQRLGVKMKTFDEGLEAIKEFSI